MWSKIERRYECTKAEEIIALVASYVPKCSRLAAGGIGMFIYAIYSYL